MKKNYKKKFGKKSNMKTLYRQILKVVLVIFIMGIIGCAAGPAYQKVEKIPENSSVVYIYRPGFAGWPEVNPNLYTDKGKTFLTKIYCGGLFSIHRKTRGNCLFGCNGN